jgi:hypothetical protein
MTVWRIKLNSQRDETDLGSPDWDAAKRYCRENDLVGVGWGLNGVEHHAPLDQVLKACNAYRDAANAQATIRRLAEQVQDLDLMWTRDKLGQFWLCQITGPWSYDNSPGSVENDMYNVRPAIWLKKPFLDGEVPGAVARAFMGRSMTLCRIGEHQAAIDVTEQLWKLRTEGPGSVDYSFKPEDAITDLFDPKDVEDLVLLYLQTKDGWILLPSSRRRDTQVYEAELRRSNGEACVVSVKTGPSNAVKLAELEAAAGPRQAFAFSSRGAYSEGSDTVIRIEREHLVKFMHDHPALLPPRMSRWLTL